MAAMRIATYTVTTGTFQQVLDIATAPGGVSELYQSLPGFVRFDIVNLGDDMFASLTTWDSRSAAEAAVAAAAAWVKDNLSDRVQLASNAVGDLAYEA